MVSVDTIASFKDQLLQLDEKIRAHGDIESMDAKISKSLHNVFDFYCKQHINYGRGADSFGRLQEKLNYMNLGDWMCFIRDFGLIEKGKIPISIITNIFKNKALGKETISFEQFRAIL